MAAIVMCARKDHPDDVFVNPGNQQVSEEPCAGGCGFTLVVSPSSAKLPDAEFFCNPCGKAKIATLDQAPLLGIAPGALQQPGDARRRHELESHGFRQMSEADVDRLLRG